MFCAIARTNNNKTILKAPTMDRESSQNDTQLGEEKIRELIDATLKVKSRAHAPYSNFKVGAALLTKDGRIFTGTYVASNVPHCVF